MTGIEPAPTAWEAVVLPLNYIRILFSQLVYFTTPLHFCLMFERLFLFPHVKQTPFMTAPDPDEFICVTACFQAPLFAVSITFRYLNAFCFPYGYCAFVCSGIFISSAIKLFYVYMFLTDIPHHTFFLFTKQAKNFLTPCLHRHIMYAHMYITVIIF